MQADNRRETAPSRTTIIIAVLASLMFLVSAIAWLMTRSVTESETTAVVQRAALRVSSIPAGATLYLDGVRKGTTPLEVADLDSGTYRIMLNHPDHSDLDTTVIVPTGQIVAFESLPLPLVTAMLSIETTPPGAEVWLDKRRAGVTPFRTDKAMTGLHGLRLIKQGYVEIAAPVTVTAPATKLRYTLESGAVTYEGHWVSKAWKDSLMKVRAADAVRLESLASQAKTLWLAGSQRELKRTLAQLWEIDMHHPAVEKYRYLRGDHIATLSGHSRIILSVAITPDGETIVSGSADSTARVWSMNDGSLILTLLGHTDRVSAVAATDRVIITGGHKGDKTLRVWDRDTGKLIRVMKGHDNAIWDIELTPDEKTLVTASLDGTIGVWRLSDGRLIRRIKGHTGAVWAVRVTPDAKRIISAGKDKNIRVWDFATGKLLKKMRGDMDEITSLAVSPDGKTVAAGSQDYRIYLWDMDTAKLKKTLIGHTNYVLGLEISSDGQYLISGGGYRDASLKIWDIATGRPLRSMKEHNRYIRTLALSRDGMHIVTGGADKRIMVWRAP